MTRTIDSDALIKPANFAHFVLRVSNLEASIAWYETVLGMEMVHRAEKIAFMTYDHEHHRIALAETPVEGSTHPAAAGLDHVAYTLNSLGELLGTYRRLKAKGIEPALPINHGPTTSIYYKDPDRNGVEFQVENFDNVDALNAFMRSEAFEKNPLGVPIEKLLEQGAG